MSAEKETHLEEIVGEAGAAPETHAVQEEHGGGIHISLKAEPIFHIGSYAITNALILATLILVLFSAIAISARKRLKLVPGGLQNLFEAFMEFILDMMDSVLGDRHKSEKYLPLIATIFLFVMFSNWFGLLPGVGSIMFYGAETVPLLRAPSADLNFTLALAVITVLTVNLFGAFAIGAFRYAGKFFNFRDPIGFFVGIIELVSEGARMISFSFRLFGNIFAGEVLLTIVAFLTPYLVPLPFLFLEVFVGAVQALIFSMLALVFIAIAITDHHGPEDAGHATAAH
ncbi:MAG: F0F1 ATP synthase subunit A [Candidatus Liptonbacteria bacterium]